VPAEPLSARQREVLDVARGVLDREGVEALTLGRVARELGIKTPSLYKHFESKRRLDAMLIAEGLAAHAEAVGQAGGDLAAIAAAYRRFALGRPHLYRLMTEQPLPRDELPEGLEARAAAPLIEALGDRDLARAAWGLAHGLVQLELAGRFPADADVDAAWAAGVASLKAAAR
jgi:AcrR family transcriptional regulator